MKQNACRPIDDTEMKLVLLGVDNPRDRALIIVGARSGFRISELLSMRLEDLYPKGKIADRIRVHSSHMKGQKQFREIKLHPDAKVAIEALGPRREGYLFTSQKGGQLSRTQAWRVIVKAFRTAGLEGKLACHSLRKTFSVNVYNASGYDIVKTRDLLGHSSISTTNDYLASNRKDLDDIIDKI